MQIYTFLAHDWEDQMVFLCKFHLKLLKHNFHDNLFVEQIKTRETLTSIQSVHNNLSQNHVPPGSHTIKTFCLPFSAHERNLGWPNYSTLQAIFLLLFCEIIPVLIRETPKQYVFITHTFTIQLIVMKKRLNQTPCEHTIPYQKLHWLHSLGHDQMY